MNKKLKTNNKIAKFKQITYKYKTIQYNINYKTYFVFDDAIRTTLFITPGPHIGANSVCPMCGSIK